MRRILEALGGGFIVYAVMASCAADRTGSRGDRMVDAGTPTFGDDAARGIGGIGGRTPGDATTSGDDGHRVVEASAEETGSWGGRPIFDGSSVVRDANAQESGTSSAPTVVVRPCDVTGMGGSYKFAVLDLPGKTNAELSRVVAILGPTLEGVARPAGLNHMNAVTFFDDGRVAAWCLYGNQEATFVVP